MKHGWLISVLGLLPVSAGAVEEPLPLAMGALQPAISPDGTHLAVSYQGAIGVMPAEGGTLRLLTRDEGWDVEPAWSPDGRRIAFLRTRSFSFAPGRLQIVDVESGEAQPLPKPVKGEGRLWWHPDGKRLLGFLDERQPQRLAWLDLESGALRALEIGAENPAENRRKRMRAALSPDGSEIAFLLHPDVPDEQSGLHGPAASLRICRSDGSEVRELVTWPARIYDLIWSPDGNALIAVTDRGTSHDDLWMIPRTEPLRNARKLTFGQADEARPSLSRDGSRLFFTGNGLGATTLTVHHFSSGVQSPIQISELAFGEEPGRLRLELDGEPGDASRMARVSVQQMGGKFYSPPGSLYRLTGNLGHFYTSGCEFEVPAGSYVIRAWRGMESLPAQEEVVIEPGKMATVSLRMKRWIHLRERGWYSGENHVHANYGYGEWYNTPDSILRQCQGEDLQVCNAVVANSDGDGVFDREFFLGRPDPQSTPDTILYWNQEFRATLWGHLTLSNLPRLVEPIFTGFAETTNPWDVPTNADVALDTWNRGGVVSYTHPAGNALDLYDQPYAAKGVPVDAALGRVHALDVMGHTYPGSVQLWYHLLNCGFKVVASAGTDCFLNRVRSYPPGWGRCYVRLPERLSYQGWVRGQVEGRSFISNGPVVFLDAGGAGPGDEVILDGPEAIEIRVEAQSHFPLDAVELVYNGEVIRTFPLEEKRRAKITESVKIPGSGWLALRARGPVSPGVLGRGLWAHTNPVAVKVGDEVWHSRESAHFFLEWLERLEADFRRRDRVPNQRERERVEAQMEAARKVYRELAGS